MRNLLSSRSMQKISFLPESIIDKEDRKGRLREVAVFVDLCVRIVKTYGLVGLRIKLRKHKTILYCFYEDKMVQYKKCENDRVDMCIIQCKCKIWQSL